MRSIQIVTGEIYHICNRAIEDRIIFSRPSDCNRFLKSVFLSNSFDIIPPARGVRIKDIKKLETADKLVNISALCLMKNHFHILAEQIVDDGIAKFMQRLGNSYAKFYNQKYERKGSLFLGPYKAVHITSDAQAAHIFTYIHANPLDYIEPNWRDGKINKWPAAKKYLIRYPWSSLGVHLGNAPRDDIRNLIINPEFAKVYYKRQKEYIDAIRDWGSRNNKEFLMDISDTE